MIEIDGIAVHVEGDGDETLVMIHGWPDTWRLWDAQVNHFGGRYRCVRFTLPGFDPRLPPRRPTLEQLLAFFEQVLRRVCNGRPAILMVHDWGAAFGYQLCMRNPELVSRVIGIDVGDAGREPRYRSKLRRRDRAMMVSYQVWLALAWRIGGRIGDAMTRWMARLMQVPRTAEPISACMNYPYHHAWFNPGAFAGMRPARPPQPMLFAYGRRKPYMFHSSEWEVELRARSDCAVVGFDTGHWVTQSAAFNDTVQAWLDGQRDGEMSSGVAPKATGR